MNRRKEGGKREPASIQSRLGAAGQPAAGRATCDAGSMVLRPAGCAPPAPHSPAPSRACASCPSSSGMLLPLLRSSCFPSSSPGSGGGGGRDPGAGSRPPDPLERADTEPPHAAEAGGAPGPGARSWRRAEREPYACMDPGAALHRRAGGGGGGLGAGSPALSGGQARRRKQPPRPADFKLQVIIIGSRGVGKTSLMERFTDDTFCEACKSTVGKAGSSGLGPAGFELDRWAFAESWPESLCESLGPFPKPDQGPLGSWSRLPAPLKGLVMGSG
jgi:hypothetical protein